MADDRPAESEVEAIARLARDLDDLRSTALARASRMPTGHIEATLLKSPKSDTLFLHGQTLSRAAYPVLWQWILDNGLNGATPGPDAPFGNGDGSTTFVLPDTRGKALVGATSVDPVGKSFGSASVSLTEAMMPRHRHDGTTSWSDRTHIHGGNTDDAGHHGGHNTGIYNANHGNLGGFSVADNTQIGNGNHYHHFTSVTESQGHLHGFTTAYHGTTTPTPFFVVQPSYALNVMIWT